MSPGNICITPEPFATGLVLSIDAVIVWQGTAQNISAAQPVVVPDALLTNFTVIQPLVFAPEAWILPGLFPAPPPEYVPMTGAVVSGPS